MFKRRNFTTPRNDSQGSKDTSSLSGMKDFGWLFWVERSFETIFQSISGRLPKRERKRRETIDESKNVQTTPTRTHCKRSRPLPYYQPNKKDAPALEVYPAPSHHPTTPRYERKRIRSDNVIPHIVEFTKTCKMSWKTHIDRGLQASLGLHGYRSQLVSVKDIISKSGFYSGLVLKIKEHISSANWGKCVLSILRRD